MLEKGRIKEAIKLIKTGKQEATFIPFEDIKDILTRTRKIDPTGQWIHAPDDYERMDTVIKRMSISAKEIGLKVTYSDEGRGLTIEKTS